MMQILRRNNSNNMGLFSLLCITLALGYGNAKLTRGISSSFDALKELASHPMIRDDIRGKTLKELGVEEEQSNPSGTNTKSTRRTEIDTSLTGPTYSYFAVYDEFGPSFANLGDTAGLRGIIYDNAARKNGLKEDYVAGSLQATCALVASKGTQLCSYEVFMLDKSTGSMGTIVATGSLDMKIDSENFLIIEATGDDYVEFNGGLLGITYKAIGTQYVIAIEIMF